MPPVPAERTVIAGVPVRVLKLDPFEASAPLKLKMALLWATRDVPN
jgi:HPr kinase/phosphorylase